VEQAKGIKRTGELVEEARTDNRKQFCFLCFIALCLCVWWWGKEGRGGGRGRGDGGAEAIKRGVRRNCMKDDVVSLRSTKKGN